MSMKETITTNGKVVGVLRGGNLYQTATKKDLYKFVGDRGSWGLEYTILHSLPERCTVYITVPERQYSARTGIWKEYGELRILRQGFKEQATMVFLPIEYFDQKVIPT
jgi:hypothetical protein